MGMTTFRETMATHSINKKISEVLGDANCCRHHILHKVGGRLGASLGIVGANALEGCCRFRSGSDVVILLIIVWRQKRSRLRFALFVVKPTRRSVV
jgi:hypothetical protein